MPNGGPVSMVWGVHACFGYLHERIMLMDVMLEYRWQNWVLQRQHLEANLFAWIVGCQTFTATSAQTFGVYVAIVLSHAVICCLGTAVLARLPTVYVVLNVCLCLAVIIGLPAATPKANTSFDSSVHISEESSNAATAVPWAIVSAIGIAGILGWGMSLFV
ncbi:hypothetical protein DEU56DRAFT_952544 [Suillus clintonianus]|uniref:uncharacterized protein n=1 Tax=Suillus clintonianus TaxID=1904413 RepID=UPI001B883F9E|nr:uncharacterized protein DEU56DRAFT_952544 [Suillus clintonianus]KAG2132334.1 hypothetical protein DEU56DRAFT_952544 [Suillus clintonianus]